MADHREIQMAYQRDMGEVASSFPCMKVYIHFHEVTSFFMPKLLLHLCSTNILMNSDMFTTCPIKALYVKDN